MSDVYKRCPSGHYYQGDGTCPYCGSPQEEINDSPKSEMSGNDMSRKKDNKALSDVSLKWKRLVIRIGIVYYIFFLLLFGFVLYSFTGNSMVLKVVSPCLFIGYVVVFDLVVYKLFYKDDKYSGSFKVCPNGHCYIEDECPYCKSTNNTSEVRIVKVCHRGHGYAEKEQSCPFCGDKAVARTVKVVDPITCWFREFCYKKGGTPMPLHYASVDGSFITGENICFRVYYYGEFKYDYGISEYGQYEHEQFLSVSPESIVLLKGKGFADTYTGKDFYRMCDDLFEEDESEKDERQQLTSNKTTKGFKKCPNGHYYKGDECPYCKSMNIKNSITIGRSIENDVIVDDPLVTRKHCKIERVGEDRYIITAFVTENGTYVNGKKLEGSMEIGPSDDVMMGKTHVQWLHLFGGSGSGEPLGGDVEPL